MAERRQDDNGATEGPKSSLILLECWAAATTDIWTKEVQREVRRQKRIETSLRFRARKKHELKQLRAERDQLELEVQRCLTALEISTTKSEDSTSDDLFPVVYRLALESDALRAESIEIQQNLQVYNRFFSRTNEAFQAMTPHSTVEQNTTLLSVREASKASLSVTCRDVPGWRVYFPSGEPSFYFYPFTRVEFDSKFEICEEITSAKLPCTIENLFGWTVFRAPLASRPGENPFFAHARFTTRVGWALDDADAFMTTVPMGKVSTLFVPSDGNRSRRELVNMQVLQEFDSNSFVMVCNIPNQGHTRFFQLPRRVLEVGVDGKRSISYQMVMADTEANQRSRDAEADVKWVNEGGVCMKFTEVDDTIIDVSGDYWAGCESERHAQLNFILWAEGVCQWSQMMAPSRLLG